MEIEGACEEVAINVKNNLDSEDTLRLRGMFDWIRDTEFGDGSLAKILEHDGLIVMDSDTEAKEFLLGLHDQIFKDVYYSQD